MRSNPVAEDIHTIARDCLAVRLRLLHRVINGIYDEALRPHGLTVSQMNILVVVGRAGELRAVDVCRILALDPSTLSRNMERMRERGWVQRSSHSDRRSQLYHLTAAGAERIHASMPGWKRAQADAKRILGGDGITALLAAVSAVSDGDSDV